LNYLQIVLKLILKILLLIAVATFKLVRFSLITAIGTLKFILTIVFVILGIGAFASSTQKF